MAASDLQAAAALAEREHQLLAALSGYAGVVPLLPDKLAALRSAARALSTAKVAYALIGGLAVGIRSGVPRATLDVDLAVTTKASRKEIIARLVAAGFALVGEFAHSVNFRHESGEPLQLAFDSEFDAMIARATPIDLDDLALPVVTKDDLIAMKRRAAADPARRRSKALRDQADVLLLEGDTPDHDEGW